MIERVQVMKSTALMDKGRKGGWKEAIKESGQVQTAERKMYLTREAETGNDEVLQ